MAQPIMCVVVVLEKRRRFEDVRKGVELNEGMVDPINSRHLGGAVVGPVIGLTVIVGESGGSDFKVAPDKEVSDGGPGIGQAATVGAVEIKHPDWILRRVGILV